MRSLGDKISSTIVAQSAKVPCMDWSGTGIDETILSDDGYVTVSDDVYQRACVSDADDGLVKAERIGYPVMIKASEGGGGKGIRMVAKSEDFKQSFGAVQGEVPGASTENEYITNCLTYTFPSLTVLYYSARLQARPSSS